MPTIQAAKADHRPSTVAARIACRVAVAAGALALVTLLPRPSVIGIAFGQGATADETDEAAAAKSQSQGMTPGTIVQPIRPAPPVVAARTLFGAVREPTQLPARSIGGYARGCLAGGRQLAVDGPAWQAMRLSRDRQWGHPDLIAFLERFSADAKANDGWSGFLVGDMSQPRGGPMLTGHASHQIGLDADIWFTPMPDRRLTRLEREEMPAVSMLAAGHLSVEPKVWSDKHVRLIKRATTYPEIERVLVHPAIKKALCEASAGQPEADRAWLAKVRPIWGHYYHFHVRLGCPKDTSGCVAQAPTKADDGCGKEIDDWYALLKRPVDPNAKPGPEKPPMTLEQLPAECRIVLEAGRGTMVPKSAAKKP